MLRIIVVDDHPLVREGVRRIISENKELSVVAEATDGEEGLRTIRNHPCDLVLLDIGLPKKSGLEVLTQIRSEKPQLPVLVFSMHSEEQYALRVLRAGAFGYLTKESAAVCLMEAIRKVLRGGRYVSPELAQRLAFRLRTDSGKPPHEALSDREYQFLCLLAKGKTVSEIAADLSLNVKTVSTYRTRALEKMGYKNNAELIYYALKNGLVD
jgi:DNA-binding NarL/FixJ family response regulator